jgi:hypothetical protein
MAPVALESPVSPSALSRGNSSARLLGGGAESKGRVILCTLVALVSVGGAGYAGYRVLLNEKPELVASGFEWVRGLLPRRREAPESGDRSEIAKRRSPDDHRREAVAGPSDDAPTSPSHAPADGSTASARVHHSRNKSTRAAASSEFHAVAARNESDAGENSSNEVEESKELVSSDLDEHHPKDHDHKVCRGGPLNACRCLLGCKVFGAHPNRCENLRGDHEDARRRKMISDLIAKAMKEPSAACLGMYCIVKCAAQLECLDEKVMSDCQHLRKHNPGCELRCDGHHNNASSIAEQAPQG